MNLALRVLYRQRRAPELRALALALVLAAAAVVAVSATADRVRQGLAREGAALLGGDLALYGDHAPADAVLRDAVRRGLSVAVSRQFPTMLLGPDGRSRLVDLKAVSDGFPLRGAVRLATPSSARPALGAAWLDRNLAASLGLQTGDAVRLGRARFVVSGWIVRDPDVGSGFFRIAPRVMVRLEDLAATGLVTAESRVAHRLVVAGPGGAVDAFRDRLAARLERGQRIESAREARPEVGSALDRAERYLGLAALLSVVLAAVAAVLAGHRFAVASRHAASVMRALGARRAQVFSAFAGAVIAVALAGGAIGAGIGFALALFWGVLVGGWVGTDLPWPAASTLLLGFAASLVAAVGFALPPLLKLLRGTVLEGLHGRPPAPDRAEIAAHLAGIAALGALIGWQAASARLAGGWIAGLLGAAAISMLLARLLATTLAGLLSRAGVAARHAGLSLTRRRGSPAEAAAIAVGMTALLVLTFVKDGLFDAWGASTPVDAPNRFVINLQQEQIAGFTAMFAQAGLPIPELSPMTRARLTGINGKAVSGATYPDPQTRRLVEREFNLAPAVRLAADNRLVGGKFWNAAETAPQFSVEEGIARRLGVGVGDSLRFEAAGRPIEARVTSLRKVDWDRFRVNFFVVSTPPLLRGLPASWIAAFHLPESAAPFVDRLVARFPNLTVIDVSGILAEVRVLVDRGIAAASAVFWLTLGTGVAVLFAALAASRDERAREMAIWRTLGASGRTMAARQWIEFALLGTVAGTVAAAAASVIGWVLATRAFDVPWSFDIRLWLAGPLLGALGVGLVGVLGVRVVVGRPSLASLRATE